MNPSSIIPCGISMYVDLLSLPSRNAASTSTNSQTQGFSSWSLYNVSANPILSEDAVATGENFSV